MAFQDGDGLAAGHFPQPHRRVLYRRWLASDHPVKTTPTMTQSVWPLKPAISWPLDTSHNRTVLSQPLLASV